MAIQIRRGNYADFDATRMVAGEMAVCLDNGYVFVTLSAGNVIKLGTADTIDEALTQAQAYVENARLQAEASETSATSSSTYSKDAEAWANGKRNGQAIPSTDSAYNNNAKYYSEKAKEYKDTMQEALDNVAPQFSIDWSTGELLYTSSAFSFYTDDSGMLHWATE